MSVSHTICPGHWRPVAGIEFSQDTEDGVFLISACHDKTAMLRRGDTGDWIGTFQGHKGAVWGAALNRGATRAVTCSADFSAKVWDAVSGDELAELSHRHIVRAADWASDSASVFTGGKEAKLRRWDLASPSEAAEVMTGHGGMIKVVRQLPDAPLIATGSEDKTVRLWDVRTHKEVTAAQQRQRP